MVEVRYSLNVRHVRNQGTFLRSPANTPRLLVIRSLPAISLFVFKVGLFDF
jgi:hypothetical protein